MRKYLTFFFLALPLLSTACRPVDTPQEILQKNEILLTPPATSVIVTREDCTAIEVAPGTQVMWVNGDTVTLAITLEQLDESGAVTDTTKSELQPNAFMTMVFNEPAAYRYTCSEDMDWYSTITVK